MKRIAILYVISCGLYAPLYVSRGWGGILAALLFGYHHLWYLSALLYGLILANWIERILGKWCFGLIGLLLIGILLDEYVKIGNIPILTSMSQFVKYIGGSRSSLLFALPMLLIGMFIARFYKNINFPRKYYMLSFVLFLTLGFIESTWLKERLGLHISADLTFFGWLPAVPLLLMGLKLKSPLSPTTSRYLRKEVDVVYIIHIWVAFIITHVLFLTYMPRFLFVLGGSVVLACGIICLFRKYL